MYINRAYLGQTHEDIATTSVPLLVTAVGNFRVHSRPLHQTKRESGRQDYSLVYVAEGKLHLFIQGNERIVPQGHMLLFRPGEAQHYCLYAQDQPETYWVHFTGSQVEALLEQAQMQPGTPIFPVSAAKHYPRLFRQMIQELQLKRPHYADLLALKLRELLLFISRSLEEGALVSASLLDEIEQAMAYFHQHFDMPIVIEDYARQHHMTPWWFIQNFKKIAQVTPAQYLVSLRINHALSLLDHTDYAIAKVAAAVGYDNPLYFSRLFHKHVGCSPSAYKKQKERG